MNCNKNVQVGNDLEKAQSEKESHSKNPDGKKLMKTYRKPNEQLFSQQVATQSYLNLTKNMKTYIRHQQHKKNLNTKT